MHKLKLQYFGSPALKLVAAHTKLPDTSLAEITHELIAAVRDNPKAAGMAACQLGSPAPLLVIKWTTGEIEACFNPSIITTRGTTAQLEGCLSTPGFTATVLRAKECLALWQDEDGAESQHWLTGKDGRTFQHCLGLLHGKPIAKLCSADDYQAGKSFINAAKRMAEDAILKL